MRKTIVIGLAGGSGSGKRSIARIIAQHLNTKQVTVLHEKGYYRNQSQEPKLENQQKNFDHPKVFNNALLIRQLKKLMQGQKVKEPYYSFQTHQEVRKYAVVKHPAEVIIVEGPLVLYDERLRHLMCIKAYVEADADIRFLRRLNRDVNQRELSMQNSIHQYLSTVRPMHEQFVEPTKRYADIIIPQSWRNKVTIDLLTARINDLLKNK